MNRAKKANWFFLVAVCIFVGGSFLLSFINAKVELPENLSVMSGQVLITVAVIGYILFTRENPFKIIKHERLGIVDILLVVLVMFLCLPLVYFINFVSMAFTENEIADTLFDMVDNPYLLNLAMIALTPAIVEEMVCRGILYYSYKTKSTIFAIIMSAFIFGLLHMNLNQMLYAMAIGIVFCIVVEATGSIYSSMIMHFIMNSISTTMMALLKLLMKSGVYSEEMLEETTNIQSQAADFETPVIINVMLIMIGLLVVIAFSTLAAAVIIYLAKRRGHYEDLKAIFKKQKKEHYTLEDIAEKKSSAIDYIKEYAPFAIAVAICFVVMIFL